MKNVPQPKEQARILKAALAEMGVPLKHQAALGVVARLMGARDWPTLSAAFEAEQEQRAAQQRAVSQAMSAIAGPEDGDLYEALVTVDQTLSARIRVRAHSLEEAKGMFGSAACAQYPHGFELDDGNYRGPSDFYLGDSDAVENLSEPQFDEDGVSDYSASATWQDERFTYRVELSRDEPDCASESRRAKVTQTLTVTREGVSLSRESRLEVYGDLQDYLREAIAEGDLEDDLAALVAKFERQLQRQAKQASK
jgi:hypothetical protein